MCVGITATEFLLDTINVYLHSISFIYILIRVCDSSSGLHGPLIANPSGCLKSMWASHVTSRVKVCLYNEIRTHQPISFPHRSRLVSPAAILSTTMTYKLTWPLLTWPDLETYPASTGLLQAAAVRPPNTCEYWKEGGCPHLSCCDDMQ